MVLLQSVKESLPPHVELVAVSKFHPAELIRQAYDQGQRIFGESRVQELQAKRSLLPADIAWHFIGHLQPNKVKYIAPYISLIHAVDSLKLLREIDKQAAKCERCIDCLLELRVAKESTKFGFMPDECESMLCEGEWKALSHVRIRGLMCMATNTDDETQVRREFQEAKAFFDHLKRTHFADSTDFNLRSWGMTHDYPIAVEEGANMVRIGTAIFGEREY